MTVEGGGGSSRLSSGGSSGGSSSPASGFVREWSQGSSDRRATAPDRQPHRPRLSPSNSSGRSRRPDRSRILASTAQCKRIDQIRQYILLLEPEAGKGTEQMPDHDVLMTVEGGGGFAVDYPAEDHLGIELRPLRFVREWSGGSSDRRATAPDRQPHRPRLSPSTRREGQGGRRYRGSWPPPRSARPPDIREGRVDVHVLGHRITSGVPTGIRRHRRRTARFRTRMQPWDGRPGIRKGSLVPWMPMIPPPGQSLRTE